MIFCKNCEFEVNNSMRHSLMRNCCPSCGAALLGDVYMRRLELLKQRILEQEFSNKLDKDLIFDLSLFMLSEFFPTKSSEENVEENVEESSEEERVEEPVVMEPAAEESYESIRDEVRSEMLSQIEDGPEDSSEDLKVARLKRIAKETKVRSPGAIVRRAGD
jgi:hypothetical protein